MTTDFSFLQKHKPEGDKPRPYIMQLGNERVRLYCLPATRANKAWWNNALRAGEDAVNAGKQVKIDDNFLDNSDIEDAKSFGEFCIVGWDEEIADGKLPLLDGNGKPIKWSKKEAIAFMDEIGQITYAIERLRRFLTNDLNFVDSVNAAPGDLGK